jgi:two-component system chemotaxis response regulator CheB
MRHGFRGRFSSGRARADARPGSTGRFPLFPQERTGPETARLVPSNRMTAARPRATPETATPPVADPGNIPRIVVIGASQGGVEALQTVLRGLPVAFPAPVAVVLHRDRRSEPLLARLLQRHSILPVAEVTDKLMCAPGQVYLAPADYHLLLEPGAFALSIDAPVRWSRPSIDLLFESAADAYGPGVIGVSLTGANADGAMGAVRIIDRGGLMLVQDPASAESPVMPQAVLAATGSPHVQPLDQIAPWLTRRLIRNPAVAP